MPVLSVLGTSVQSVKTVSTVDRWADEAGFAVAKKFAGSKTAVGPRRTVRYAGFYLLAFDDNTYYVGESVNLRSRMGGHNTAWGEEITTVRFLRQNLSKQQLRAQEKKLIHQLNAIIPEGCRSKTHASVTAGVDALDEFLTEDEQKSWLKNPRAFNNNDDATLKAMSAAQETKYSTNFRKFSKLETAPQLTTALRSYLENCIPAPRRTEFQSWNVSANTYNGQRAFCVSVGKMEVCVGFPNGTGFIVVRRTPIFPTPPNRRFAFLKAPAERAFARRHRDVDLDTERTYDDAGEDQITLRARTPQAFTALLTDPQVLHAGAALAYAVTKKHPSTYARYHCPQLVEHVYSEFDRPAPEPALLIPPMTADASHEPNGELQSTEAQR